jgi:hypothetical protein
MHNEDYLNKKDLYEVDREDYDAYFYRLPKDALKKFSLEDETIIFEDTVTGEWICGYKNETSLIDVKKYYIFSILPDTRLSDYKTQKRIILSDEEYTNFLKSLMKKEKERENG